MNVPTADRPTGSALVAALLGCTIKRPVATLQSARGGGGGSVLTVHCESVQVCPEVNPIDARGALGSLRLMFCGVSLSSPAGGHAVRPPSHSARTASVQCDGVHGTLESLAVGKALEGVHITLQRANNACQGFTA